MKKIIAGSIVALGLALPLQAFADTPTTTTNTNTNITLTAKYSPDSMMYPLHTFLEQLHLFFASEGTNKAAVLQQTANERLAEAKNMLEQSKANLTVEQLKAYQDALNQLQAQLNLAIAKGQDVTDVVKTIDNEQPEVDSATKDITKNLTNEDDQKLASDVEDDQSDVKDLTDTVKLVTPITGDKTTADAQEKYSLHQQAVQKFLAAKVGSDALAKATAEGLNARQIMAIQSLTQLSGKTFDDVLNLFNQNSKGIGAAVKALSLQPKEAMKTINSDFHKMKKDVKAAFKHGNQTDEQGNQTDEQGQSQDSTQTGTTQDSTDANKGTTNQGEAQATNQDSAQVTSQNSTSVTTQSSTSTAIPGATKNKSEKQSSSHESQGNNGSNADHNAQGNTSVSGKDKGQELSQAAHQANVSLENKQEDIKKGSNDSSENGDSNGQGHGDNRD
ncbi:MAG: DUF5667 domain-containing protein [Bacillota bacterium]|nr:DUF5667 domain-containing protein [Bacillota bacterium]